MIAYNEFGISPPTATREEVGFVSNGQGKVLIDQVQWRIVPMDKARHIFFMSLASGVLQGASWGTALVLVTLSYTPKNATLPNDSSTIEK